MPDPTTIERLRGLVLSANDLSSLTEWPDALIEDYLNIVDNLITISNLLDAQIDQKIEEVPTAFIDGSVPFADSGLLVEDNVNIIFNNVTKVLTLGGVLLSNLTASRLAVSDANKNIVSIASDITSAELETLSDNSMADTLHRHSELSASDGTPDAEVRLNATGGVGVGIDATAVLHLKAGTAVAGTGQIKFEDGTLLAAPEDGVLEFAGKRLYITNIAHQRAIDRTSDVAVATVTVEDTLVETVLWTGDMAANSLVAGNMFKFHADGIVNNASAGAGDRITLRIRIGTILGAAVATINPAAGNLTNAMWHIDANACQRTIGVAGPRAIHIMLKIGATEVGVMGVANIDTTAIMDVILTAQWGNANAANIIHLYQGYMEYKN